MEKPDQIITFQTFYDPMLAHIIRTKLEDEGIKCFITDENSALLNPLYNQALGGIKLKIFAADMERCQAIIAADDALQGAEHFETDPETHQVLICPYCGSTNVQQNMPTEKKRGWQGLVSTMLSLFTFFTDKTWHCLNCLHNFD